MDLVINNGRMVNFERDKIEEKNIGIKHGKIAKITSTSIAGRNIIDAKGCIISPGFIDIHTHSDYNFNFGNKQNPFETAKHLLLMGVTTSVGGNCGSGAVNIQEYLDYIDKEGAPNNYAGLIGHRSLREVSGVSGVYSSASNSKIKKMVDLAIKSLENGAVGISLGLEYSPGANFEEVVRVCSVLSDFPDSIISAHSRYDGDDAIEALNELIEISKQTNAPMQVSHINSCICFGYAVEGLKLIENARKNGVDILADAYPYTAWSTSAGSAAFDKESLKRKNIAYHDIMVAEGKFTGQRCDERLFEHIRHNYPETRLISFVMNEREVDEVLLHPLVVVGSDGNINNKKGHPRSAGSFPRALYRYAINKQAVDFIYMLKKMTKLPANRLGLTSKGEIKEGADADIVVLNPSVLKDHATYEKPVQPPSGIEYVIINGTIAVKQNKILNPKAGKSIRRMN